MRPSYEDDPNTSGPGGLPVPVWIALVGMTLFALFVFFKTRGQDSPGQPAPTPPSVIMPVNSWSS